MASVDFPTSVAEIDEVGLRSLKLHEEQLEKESMVEQEEIGHNVKVGDFSLLICGEGR